MTKSLIQRVHAVAMGSKGLNEEAYRLRLRAVGVASCKQFSREQYREFMRGLAKLPDVKRARA